MTPPVPATWPPIQAGAAALGWFSDVAPLEPVVLCAQTANVRSTRLATPPGFAEVERFEEYRVEQWFGVWRGGLLRQRSPDQADLATSTAVR